ncbi:unnamed protein product [Cuscuta campestris]|uniref:Uncharacterized protein n=1 Tax=Cuscuta campestris TaxID=132261 RepID=A0A484LNP2_9ASTE|nr:unnamed protein product [Cuscuta campestris]
MEILSKHGLSKERRGEGNATKKTKYTQHQLITFPSLKCSMDPKSAKTWLRPSLFSFEELKFRFKEMQISSLKSGSRKQILVLFRTSKTKCSI